MHDVPGCDSRAIACLPDEGERDAGASFKALRIAMFVNEFPALSETFVLNQITGLLDLGHDVTIIATRPRYEAGVHHDVLRYRLWERLCYREMPSSRAERLARAPGICLRSGGSRPALARALNAARYGREATSLSLFYWADRLSSLRSFDIIHCHFGIVGKWAAFLREIGAIEGKLVTTFHGVDVSLSLDRDPGIYRHLFEHGDLFMPVSERWRDRLIHHGCDPARIEVHRMGVDPDRFAPGFSCGGERAPRMVLSVGRLVEKKGIEFGLKAVANLAARGLTLRYEIVGDGPLRGRLEALARELGIADRVHFHGALIHDDVVRKMKSCDVLLAPSVTDAQGEQEGIPVTLMEAMASGVPVVSSRHSGIPELVEDGVSGLLAGERDVGELGLALATLLNSPERRRKVGAAARKRVVADFNTKKLNRRLDQYYRKLVAGRF